ncbi:LacI family DNA-binding transcriptional regulator [Flexivirga sp. B27]
MGATLRAVAEDAGVSQSTASKVLNGRADVSSKTKERVLRSAADLGYNARRRARHRANSVLILFDDLISPYSLSVLSGATEAAMRLGQSLVVERMLTEDGELQGLTKPWFDTVSARGIGALVTVTTPMTEREQQWCAEAGIALVVVDPIGETTSSTVSISATNWAGGREATQHLLDLGHRRIGFLNGPPASQPARERLHGYTSALTDAGIAFDPDLVLGDVYAVEPSLAAAHELLALPDPPTAVFASSDASALGALRAAMERGMSVPRDLSVVGFDDTLMARWAPIPLTTVYQPLVEMGKVAVERVLTLADDPDAFSHPFQLETHLIVRKTTGPLIGQATG